MAKRSSKSGTGRAKRGGRTSWPQRRPPDNLIIPLEAETFAVHANEAGMRLDQFLKRRLKWRSRTKVQELIAEREITVGVARVERAYRVKAHDEVRIPLSPPPADAFQIADIPLDILYEDDLFVILNKQPDIVVHPVGPHRYNTLINALHLRYRDLDDEGKDIVPKLAHRLDRETSGVLVAYKSGRHERGAPVVFENADVCKEYLAIAEGVIESDSGTIDLPLGREPGGKPSTANRIVTPDGVPARTGYRVMERFDAFTFVHLRLFTGRQHQIRVHLQAQGHPIVCDKRYGVREELRPSDVAPPAPGEEDTILLKRQALHSYRITFPHPATGEAQALEAPLPDDMARTLEFLRCR